MNTRLGVKKHFQAQGGAMYKASNKYRNPKNHSQARAFPVR